VSTERGFQLLLLHSTCSLHRLQKKVYKKKSYSTTMKIKLNKANINANKMSSWVTYAN